MLIAEPRHCAVRRLEFHYQILDQSTHISVPLLRGKRGGVSFNPGPLRANGLWLICSRGLGAITERKQTQTSGQAHTPPTPSPDTCVPFTKHIRPLNTSQKGQGAVCVCRLAHPTKAPVVLLLYPNNPGASLRAPTARGCSSSH